MLKAQLDNLDGLGESDAAHYKQTEEGTYVLDVGASGGMSLENVSKLQSAFTKVKESLKKAEKQNDLFGDLDPKAARDAIARVTELEEQASGKDTDADAKMTAAIQNLETKHAGELDTANQTGAGYLSQLREAKLGQAIADALAEHGGNPRLLTAVIKDSVRFSSDGSADFEIVDGEGVPRLSGVSGQATMPMQLGELVGSLKEDKALSGGFNGSGATGAGSKGSNSSGLSGGGANPFAVGSINLTEQGRIARSNPAEAKRLMAQADQA